MIAVLYALAMAVLLVYGLNLLWLVLGYARHDRLRPGPVPAADAVPAPDASWPAVTVQLPLYNEALVAARLLDACAALDYPRHLLEIQVLDDSTDETTAIVARRVARWKARGVPFVHVRRAHREGYKAGALAAGLRLAKGSLIAIFDADFVPPPDFLRRVVPCFDDPAVGMAQARWEHLNAAAGFLTRVQALGLDAHFAVEQRVRSRLGCFMNFNGTAGLWRRTCIEAAGGWQGDTLTEDLDLSYRAQLAGWTFRYVPDVEVPAELPADMGALRTQQFRWAKGAVETSRKLLRPLWQSRQPRRVKLEGTLHLTAHVVFPFVLLAALLHAPLLLQAHRGHGPGPLYFAVMALGLAGFAGFCLAHLFAQRDLYPDWGRRLRYLPVFIAGTMGLSLSNTQAVWQALRGRRSAFVRTPKLSGRPAAWAHRYAATRLPAVAYLEALLFVYCLAGLGVVVGLGDWAAVPFQALFACGFGLVGAANLQQLRRRTRHA